MHFSPGKIQQRVRSAQRFSHLKCIEFITYSRPTAAPTYPPVAPSSTTCFHVLVILAFSSSPRVSSTRSGIRAKNAAENKIAMEKFWDALTAVWGLYRWDLRRARILVSGTSAFHFRPRILKITAVERIQSHRRRGGLEFREASHAVGLVAAYFLLSCSFFPVPFAQTRGRVGV